MDTSNDDLGDRVRRFLMSLFERLQTRLQTIMCGSICAGCVE